MSYTFTEKELTDFIDGVFDRFYELQERMDRNDAEYEATVASINSLGQPRTWQDVVSELRQIAIAAEPRPCHRCGGDGVVCDAEGGGIAVGTCPRCGGSGWK